MSSVSSSSDVVAAQQGQLNQQIQVAMLRKQNDATKLQGDAVVQLLESAAKLGKALGKGESFDVQG